MKPRVFIIVLHLDNLEDLKECLLSCQKLSYPNYHIILVQNGPSEAGNLAKKYALFESVLEIIKSDINVGYSRGNNLGIRYALSQGADYVLLLNDDTVVSPDCLEILVKVAESDPAVGMVGPKIYYFNDPKRVWFAGARFDPETCTVTTPGADQLDEEEDDAKPFESDYLTGCCLLIKRQTLEKIGLLDERFFLYWEDVDWCLRLRAAGMKGLVMPAAHIRHKISVSAGGQDSPLRAYHKTRSHLLMARLHNPHALFKLHRRFLRDIAWLLLKSSDAMRLTKARAYLAAIKDYHLGRTGKGPQWLWSER